MQLHLHHINNTQINHARTHHHTEVDPEIEIIDHIHQNITVVHIQVVNIIQDHAVIKADIIHHIHATDTTAEVVIIIIVVVHVIPKIVSMVTIKISIIKITNTDIEAEAEVIQNTVVNIIHVQDHQGQTATNVNEDAGIAEVQNI